jgi:alanine dehydrogenase
MEQQIRIGFPRMQVEIGERRDFLPDFIARVEKYGASVYLEKEYGSGMEYTHENYRRLAPDITFVSRDEAFQQDYVVVLRCPNDADLNKMKPGSCLISMLHYPTRPTRVELLHSLRLEAVSLDSIKDDSGRRIVENLRSVAWNGMEAAFRTLRPIYPPPGFDSPERGPIQVTLLGSGAVAVHVVQAAIRYGDHYVWHTLASRQVPGVEVTVVDYDLTSHSGYMQDLLTITDILVDATQRPDPRFPVILNDWIEVMPKHAVLVDLSVDPYECNDTIRFVKGIEGIPQGNLDQYVFTPDDPAFEKIPACIPTAHRRHSVSCYSWPGIHPKECMEVYGNQLRPILRTIIECEGVQHVSQTGKFFERAISRAVLSRLSNSARV